MSPAPPASGTYLGQKTTGRGAPIPTIPSGPMAGQLDINALIGQMVDRRKTYVYDTLYLAPGATVSNTPYRFFQVPLGQPDPYNGNGVKTELQTNMTDTGKFNPPYDMILFNLGFIFLMQDRWFDVKQIVQMGWFEFKILEKTQWMGHLWRHPPGAGFSGYSTQSSESVYNNGVPMPSATWQFGDYKKYIPPSVKFSLTLNFPMTYNSFYNSSLPAEVTANLGAVGTSLPTLLPAGSGGNGIQLIAFMNGLSDGPVS